MAEPVLARRFHRFAAALAAAGRSPLNATLMAAAGDDIAAGGLVAELYDGVDTPPGSVPALRLLGALHHLVLSDRAPGLGAFYPTAGGTQSPDDVWPAALAALQANADEVGRRLRRGVQTNEPGRSTVLYPALLWLTDRFDRPIRLLEIGASSGLNLLVDRYAYVSGGVTLGAAGSPVRFDEPWSPAPDIDLAATAACLQIADRAGCDPAPLDPTDPDQRLTLLSFIWGDEVARFERTRAALALAADDPPRVAQAPAQDWLPAALATPSDGALTVVWESVMRQYVPAEHWAAIEATMDEAQAGGEPIAWLTMEPGGTHMQGFAVRVRLSTEDGWQSLATCGDHGPPVAWGATASA
jgi:hypothetical protein